jgi:mobilome CxxCx(11)CxxC protein
MLDDKTRARVEQERLNCLSAEHLHIATLRKLKNKILVVDALALSVPIVYFPFRLLFKDTTYARGIEATWEILAACLIAATVVKFLAGWQERFQKHGRLLGENIALKRQAIDLLNDDRASSESAQSFLALAAKSEAADRESLLKPKETEQQYAYREALKEWGGVSVVCPICKASPWRFMKGSCQACGNNPETAGVK